MKEIGKLLELLNEYSKNIGYFNKEDLQGQTKAWILSKEFGWIKWLVENDKIDQTNKFCVSVNVEGKGMGYTKAFEGYESLLMLLSIQDEPIRFLCEIIK